MQEIWQDERLKEEGLQILRFIFIAILRTLLDIGLWRFLVWFLEKNQDRWKIKQLLKKIRLNIYAFSQAISSFISVIVSYVANQSLVFQNSNQENFWLSFVAFMLITVGSAGLSVWIMEILTTNQKILNLLKPYPLIQKHWPLLAKIATTGVTVITNYIGYRLWVF